MDDQSIDHQFELNNKTLNGPGQSDGLLPPAGADKNLTVPNEMGIDLNIFRAVFKAFAHFWPLLIPILILLPGLAAFPYPSADAIYSDLAISHFPNAIYLKNAIIQWHELPFWSSTILSGYPFSANPLSGLWYPPGWLALFFPLPLGFNLLIILHLLWGGIGMFYLLRSEKLVFKAVLLGALAFEAMPKIFAHYGAGHLTLLYAVPWTPWLLYADRRAYQVPYTAKRFFQPGLVLALICLADVRWAVFAGILWLAYSLNRHLNRQHLGYMIRQGALAILFSAPLALPLLEYTRLSTRVDMAVSDVFTFSLPPARLLGLLFPDLGGFHEWMIYPGMVIFVLGLLTLLWKQVRSRGQFWLLVALVSILFSLGSIIPGLSSIASLPILDLLRVPSRALFITGMALAAAASYALDHLLKGPIDPERRQANLLFIGLAALILALSGAVWAFSQNISLNSIWGVGMLLAALAWISLGLHGWVRHNFWIVGLLGLILVDLGYVDHSLYAFHSAASVEAEGGDAAQFLASNPGTYRIYSPSYSMPQQTAALYGLELADGVDPLQLQSYVSYMQGATGVPWNGYSVTLPPYASGDPKLDNAAYFPDPKLLGLLNVRFVLSDFDLPVKDLVLRERFGSTRIYENLDFRPRSWVQSVTDDLDVPFQPAVLKDWRSNRIVINVDGITTGSSLAGKPRLLVLSELAYPGWQVSVDGHRTDLRVFDGVLRAVEIGPGTHQIVFTYRPLSVYAGLVLCLVGLLWLFLAPQKLIARPRNSR